MQDYDERRTSLNQREAALQDFQNKVEALNKEIAEKQASLDPLSQQVVDLKTLIADLGKTRDTLLQELNDARPKASEIIYQANQEAEKIREEARHAYDKLNAEVEGNRAVLKKNEEEFKKKLIELVDRESVLLPKEKDLARRILVISRAERELAASCEELDAERVKRRDAQAKLDKDRENLAGLRQIFEEEVLAHEQKVKAFKSEVSEFQAVRDDVKNKLADIVIRETAVAEAQAKVDAGLKSQEDARKFNDQRMADLDEFENSIKRKENALNEREAFLNKSREG